MDSVPVLCALLGVVFVAARLRHLSLVLALVGIAWMIMASPDHSPPAPPRHGRRRYPPPPPPPRRPTAFPFWEGYEAPKAEAEAKPAEAEASKAEEPKTSEEEEEGDEEEGGRDPPFVALTNGRRYVTSSGEIEDTHVVGRRPRRPQVQSPDMQALCHERLAPKPPSARKRLRRVAGVPSSSDYRSTTGQTSSYAHLR